MMNNLIIVEGIVRLNCMCGEHYCRYCNYNWNCCGAFSCPNCGCRTENPLDSQAFIKAVMEKNNVVSS